MTATATVEKYHPDFDDTSADVVLCTPDHDRFRVHSIMLKLVSGWFRTMFTLPQSAADGSADIVLDVDELSKVLAGLLTMVNGAALPSLDSIDLVEGILNAAEKYDMPGPMSIIRKLIISPPLISTPLRVYGISCRFGWVEEAKIASTHTLTMDLCAAEHLDDLGRMHGRDLARLMLLHRHRRDRLAAGLNDSDVFSANKPPGPCGTCVKSQVVHSSWGTMKGAWINGAESCPFDASLTIDDLLKRSVIDVLEATCTGCSAPLYKISPTLSRLKTLVDDLPKSVESQISK
ncbi:hypothetical protein B0H21DRAFT_891872 [Amylocystis lapponica]|nr:hypothetical protein B0H21DRAFT_891872 [Amylocystis lapponica]